MRYRLTFLLFCLLLLNTADYITTKAGLADGIAEMNPLTLYLIETGSFDKVKLLYVSLCIFSSTVLAFAVEHTQLERLFPQAYWATVVLGSIVVGMYLAIVINNVFWILI
jgi:lipid-A-disaccharide synthase-like uncharacterized protein